MESVESIISLFEPFYDQDATPIDELFPEPTFPRIEVHLLNDLFNLSKETLKKNKALLEISSPMIVVGDLHGNLVDFLKILYFFGAPPKSRYLFLGDFVDRGRYSVDVISLILSLMVKYPNDIYLIRGNHEFSHINRAYGFYDECMNTYGNEVVWNQFQEVFSYLPLAAVIGNSVFCVHGGLSPLLTSIDSIRNLPLPIPNYFNNTMISDLVWSDPVDTVRGFQLNHRGSGQIFGPDVVETFLRYNKLKIMIRGHQCTLAGFKQFANFMGITVFSSSNYCSSICNKCGVVAIKDREVLFYNIEESELGLSPSATMCLPIDGDVGLKRIFRTISRPDFHKEISPTIQSPLHEQNQNEEEEEEEDEDEFTFQLRNQQPNQFLPPSKQFIPQQQQYNSIMQMRVNMILNQQQMNNQNLQKNVPSIPTQIGQQNQTSKDEEEKNDEKNETEEEEEQNQQEEKEEEEEQNQEQKLQQEEENKEEPTQNKDNAVIENEENKEQIQQNQEQVNNDQEEEQQKQSSEEEQNEKQPEQKEEEEEVKQQEEQNEKQPEQEEEVKQQQEEQKLEEEQKIEEEQKQEQVQKQDDKQNQEEEQKQEQVQNQEDEQKQEQKQEENKEEEEQKEKEEQKQTDKEEDHHDQTEEDSKQQIENEEQQELQKEELQNAQKPEEEGQKQSEQEESSQEQQHKQDKQENDAEKDIVTDQPSGSRTPTSKHVKLAIPLPKAPGSPSSINVTFGNEPRGTHQTFLQRSRSVIDSLGGV